MSLRGVRAQLKRVGELSLGSLPVPVMPPTQPSKRAMALAELFIQFQCLADEMLGMLVGILWGQPSKFSRSPIASREPCVSGCKAGIPLDGLFEVSLRLLDSLWCVLGSKTPF